jgi:hypothetical protein
MVEKWLAVWGNGNTGRMVGILKTCDTQNEALEVVREFLRTEENPSVGAWIRRDELEDS